MTRQNYLERELIDSDFYDSNTRPNSQNTYVKKELKKHITHASNARLENANPIPDSPTLSQIWKPPKRVRECSTSITQITSSHTGTALGILEAIIPQPARMTLQIKSLTTHIQSYKPASSRLEIARQGFRLLE
jgi:hypothetical protein